MGLLSDFGGSIRARLKLKTIAAEVFATVTDRIIPHGAAELAHALNAGSGYVPYGWAQVEPEDPATVAAPGVEAPGVATPLTTQEQYHANLAMYAGRSAPGQDRTLGL